MLKVDENAAEKLSIVWWLRSTLIEEGVKNFDMLLGSRILKNGIMLINGGTSPPSGIFINNKKLKWCKPYCNLVLRGRRKVKMFTGEVTPTKKNGVYTGYACEKNAISLLKNSTVRMIVDTCTVIFILLSVLYDL